jgi:hypothetical protein
MTDYCTCGAQLPADALFCHKCGKPQREILPAIEGAHSKAQEEAPPPPPSREILPLNFRNPAAVRVALIVALTATVAFFFMPFLNWVLGGFFAVLFYRRRTGFLLNLGAGMRMGWITGVLAFVLYTIPFAIEVPQLHTQINTLIQDRLRNMPGQDPLMIEQATRFFQSGAGLATAVIFSLVAMFLIIIFLSVAGAALAAKVMGRG